MIINSKSDKGIVRKSNQDAFIAGELAPNITFAVVCDGMGGANAGNLASEIAVKTVSEYLYNSFRENMTTYDIEKVLKNAIASANLLIYNKALKDESLRGMGTTIVACVVLNSTAVFAHVGDSRLYLVNKELKQLTKDHSVVQSLIETGEITPDDAKRHPRKNVITRALGVEADVIADFSELQLSDTDTLLLCTDGLTNYVTEDIILETFNQNSITSVGDKLIELANLNGGGDNITVVTLTV